MGSYYISERQAARLLAKLTGTAVDADDMDEFSNLGIVPAYMKFKPKDPAQFPGKYFQLVQPFVVAEVGASKLTDIDAQSLMQLLPYPPLDSGVFESSTGRTWKAFAATADRQLVEITDAHYERVYAPQEVRLAAKNILRSESPLNLPAIGHSCGETWELEQDHDHDAETAWMKSPFAGSDVVHVEKRNRRDDGASAPEEDSPSMRLIIAGMLELLKRTGGPSYNRSKVCQELQKLMPMSIYRGMSESSISKAFAAATKAKADAELDSGRQPVSGWGLSE